MQNLRTCLGAVQRNGNGGSQIAYVITLVARHLPYLCTLHIRTAAAVTSAVILSYSNFGRDFIDRGFFGLSECSRMALPRVDKATSALFPPCKFSTHYYDGGAADALTTQCS